MSERIWEVTYSFHGIYHSAHEVGCVCGDDDNWHKHYHSDGIVRRQPDRVIRKPCDPIFRDRDPK